MSAAEEIERLKRLRDDGTLSEAEFETAKQKALAGPSHQASDQFSDWGMWIWLGVFALAAGAIAGVVWYLQPQEDPVAEAFAAGSALVAGAIAALKSQFEDMPMGLAVLIGLAVAVVGTVLLVGGALLILPVVLPVVLVALVWAWFSGWLSE